ARKINRSRRAGGGAPTGSAVAIENGGLALQGLSSGWDRPRRDIIVTDFVLVDVRNHRWRTRDQRVGSLQLHAFSVVRQASVERTDQSYLTVNSIVRAECRHTIGASQAGRIKRHQDSRLTGPQHRVFGKIK